MENSVRYWLVLLGLLVASINSRGFAREGELIVEEGQPRAVIVVGPEVAAAVPEIGLDKANPSAAADKVAWAARDLQYYIEKMSGARLPLHTAGDPRPPGFVQILVGRSAGTSKYDPIIPSGLTPSREEEGYAIVKEGDILVLAGNDAGPYHGTEYAVYAFLHQLGMRWYMPGEFGEVVPVAPTIRVGDMRVISRPDFKMRNWWTHWFANDLRAQETRWKIRNGMNLDTMNRVPGDSSVRQVLPPEEEKDNPAYSDIFARDAAGNVYPHMPNLASEESVQYAARIIREAFRADSTRTSWGIGADDGLPRDFSPGTGAKHMNFPSMIGRFNDPAGASTTEEWMLWVQRVSAAVRQEFPDRFLTTNGYANRATPPIGIEPDPTIWIMFAAIFSDTYHALDNPRSWMTLRQHNMLKDWTAMYDNVYMYNYLYYNLVGCGAPPIPLARRHMSEMPLLKKLGVVGFWDEGRTVRGEAGVFPTYLRARMMWDADLDAGALAAEYFAAWYGPAADPAFAFWDAMEQAIESSNIGGNEDHMLSLIYTPELIAELAGHLERAEEAARGDVWAAPRVRADRATFEYLLAYKAMERAEFAAAWAAAARWAERMNEVLKPAMEISRFYWDISTEDKPRKGQAHGYYYWGTMMRRDYYQQMAALTSGRRGEMIAVLPERARFRIDERDDGRFDGWYRRAFDDSQWETLRTTIPFYAQGKYLDPQGYPYMGVLWYRLDVDIPASAAGKAAKIHCMAAETEAWVWVNGEFVGHRPYIEAYIRPSRIDMDLGDALIPGEKNQVVVRLHTNLQAAQMPAGLASRLFIYAPYAAAQIEGD